MHMSSNQVINLFPVDECTFGLQTWRPFENRSGQFKSVREMLATMKGLGQIQSFTETGERSLEITVASPVHWDEQREVILQSFVLGVTNVEDDVEVIDHTNAGHRLYFKVEQGKEATTVNGRKNRQRRCYEVQHANV
jgi:hypothetical protein